MPLSEYEQRMLDQLEQSLVSDDPNLATEMGTPTRRPSGRHYLVSVSGTLVGVVLLIVGVAMQNALVGLLGFAVLFVSVAWLLLGGSRSSAEDGKAGSDAPSDSPRPAGGRTSRKADRWADRLEERWQKRQDGDR